MNRIIMLWVVAAGVGTSIADTGITRDRSAAPRGLVEFELVDDRGEPFASYPTPSGRSSVHRAYLEAEPEARYQIRVRNLSGSRLGLVIAVDGRNIISGQRSELEPDESMYVLEPYQSAVYAGWRTSEREVRRFYFTEREDAYASRMGDESAIGVVAAAVYKARWEPDLERQRFRSGGAAPSAESSDAAAPRAERSAGTGFGEREHSRAIRVAFSPARRASEQWFFKYEWTRELCARGVKVCTPGNRFWPERSRGFAPIPPGA